MKVALYARVSTDDKGQNPENQLAALRTRAQREGWEVVREYVDFASGGDSNRPEFQRMLGEAAQRRFDVLLCWKLDRFSREGILHTLTYLERLRKAGVRFVSDTEPFFDTGAAGEVVLAVLAWAGSYERENTSKRIKLAFQRKKNLGHTNWGRPTGSKDKKPRKPRKQSPPPVSAGVWANQIKGDDFSPTQPSPQPPSASRTKDAEGTAFLSQAPQTGTATRTPAPARR